MVGVSNLDKYLDDKDKNGRRIGDWASQAGKGKAKCSKCDDVVNFNASRKMLFQHSETSKHVKNAGDKNSAAKQRSIAELFGDQQYATEEEEDTKKQAELLEIKLVSALYRHQITPHFLDCLVPILKDSLPSSDIVQKLSLSREKGRYVALHGIAPVFEAETVQKLKECDAFVVGFDETCIKKKEDMEILVKIANPGEGIELRHYKTVELEAGGAESIKDTLLDTFQADGIDYKKKMIGTMTDWCSVMSGSLSGVNKRLEDEVPELFVSGGCPAHHVGNTIKAMVKAFDPDMKDALVNLSECIGGEKGRSLKQKKEFEKVAVEVVGRKPGVIRRFVETRWRSIRHCAGDALREFEVIYSYLKGVKKPTERQKKLIKYFVDQKEMTRLKLQFVVAATRELDEAIDFFEKGEQHAHEVYDKMAEILSSQLLKVMKEREVKNVDEESNIASKDPSELLKVDLDDEKKQRKNINLFTGEKVEQLVRKLGLDPKSPQLKWFYDAVRAAHLEACRRLIKYFKTGLESQKLEYMAALGPKNRSKKETVRRIKWLGRRFSKVVDGIDPLSGQDRLLEEVLSYSEDNAVMDVREEAYDDYWRSVADITEGSGWKAYKVLPRFALALGTFFNSNSSNERMFSIESAIGDNKSKNKLLQESLDAMLQGGGTITCLVTSYKG